MRYFDGFLPTVPISEGEKSNNEVSEVVEDSCTELIDVSDYKCECDDKVDLDSESDTVSCQSFTWYAFQFQFKRFTVFENHRTSLILKNKNCKNLLIQF